jgi:hypothetical protein
LEIPLDALPAFFGIPPVTGEREGTMSVGDGTAVGTGEKGPRVREAAEGFGSDMDLDGGAVSLQGQSGGRGGIEGEGGCVQIGRGRGRAERERRGEVEGVGLVGVEGVRGAETVGAEEGFETGEGVGEFVRVAQGALEETMLGFAREGGSKLK